VSIHDYGDKTLVFEVRGLPTEGYKDAKIGVIYYGATGYAVLNGNSGAVFDLDGNLTKKFTGGGEDSHFGNCVKAIRSRKPEDLNADILQGHLSSALCHLGNISYRLGETVSVSEAKDRLQSVKAKADALDNFERF